MSLLLALMFALPTDFPPDTVLVSKVAFDCFVRDARGGYPDRNVYYLDLRDCPSVITRTRSFGLYPRTSRPKPPASLYPNRSGRTRGGYTVDSVLVVSGAELNCLSNQRRRKDALRTSGDERYVVNFEACH